MPKNIVICSDGTGNTTVKGRGTNVFKIYEAVDIHGHKHDPNETPQIAFYDDGVGTHSLKPIRLAGGAVGFGLGRNVRQLYGALARAYEPGDRIFMFGFSRGAFTVRTLAGLVDTCGIPDVSGKTNAEIDRFVNQAYRSMRSRFKYLVGWIVRLFTRPTKPEVWKPAHAHEAHKPSGNVPVHFVGVWDTVDAVGGPIPGFAATLNKIYRFKFPDSKLPDAVQNARHAVSIDDQRTSFYPLLWDESVHCDRIKQVWFAGVHSNVGGGYAKQGVSLVALDWMMREAEAADPPLRFLDHAREQAHHTKDVNDHLYDSRAGLAVYYRFCPRNVDDICAVNHARKRLHVSVLERVAANTESYAPGNLPSDGEIVFSEPRPEYDEAKVEAVDRGPLLDKAKVSVGWRKKAHWIMFGLTVAAVIVIAINESKKAGWGSVPDALGKLNTFGGIWNTLKTSSFVLWLAIAAAAAYLIGAWAKGKMRKKFSEHWSGQTDELREGLPWP